MKLWRIFAVLPIFLAASAVTSLRAQSTASAAATPETDISAPMPQQKPLVYERPSERTKLHNYAFDVVGPYPIIGAAFAAGINQAESTPPEWKQGAAAYGKRFASDFGIAGITTSARYTLAEVFREDTIYYRCECSGILPRLGHAVISTVTARRGDDGHRVFSVPSLISPYAGTMAAVYLWFPNRYDARDGFRMGNYNLLGFVGGNIALEFIYGGPHTLLSRFHLGKK